MPAIVSGECSARCPWRSGACRDLRRLAGSSRPLTRRVDCSATAVYAREGASRASRPWRRQVSAARMSKLHAEAPTTRIARQVFRRPAAAHTRPQPPPRRQSNAVECRGVTGRFALSCPYLGKFARISDAGPGFVAPVSWPRKKISGSRNLPRSRAFWAGWRLFARTSKTCGESLACRRRKLPIHCQRSHGAKEVPPGSSGVKFHAGDFPATWGIDQ
jgi:hypothetical protein